MKGKSTKTSSSDKSSRTHPYVDDGKASYGKEGWTTSKIIRAGRGSYGRILSIQIIPSKP